MIWEQILKSMEESAYRWLAMRRMDKRLPILFVTRHSLPTSGDPQNKTAGLLIAPATTVCPPRRLPMPLPSLVPIQLHPMGAAFAASLRAVPCAACTNDARSISMQSMAAELMESDPAHCDVCHLNFPTRIAIGNRWLTESDTAIQIGTR